LLGSHELPVVEKRNHDEPSYGVTERCYDLTHAIGCPGHRARFAYTLRAIFEVVVWQGSYRIAVSKLR
jgi:hypothetical protein